MEAEMENVMLGFLGGKEIHTDDLRHHKKMKLIQDTKNRSESTEFMHYANSAEFSHETQDRALEKGVEFLQEKANEVAVMRKQRVLKQKKTSSLAETRRRSLTLQRIEPITLRQKSKTSTTYFLENSSLQ